jgi:hypothetical protein
MKFLRTSSSGCNNDIRFNINEMLNFLEWKFLDFVKNEVILDRFFNYRQPLSAFDFSKKFNVI